MTWGGGTDEYEARDIFTAYLDAGGNFIDTADVYTDGEAERMLGALIKEADARDEIVLATKAVSKPGTSRRFDASRRHLMNSLEGSLRRLGVDHIDLWQLHAWDPLTPLDETLSVLDAAVRSGKVRYVGVSNYCGWQLATAATLQTQRDGGAPIASNQVEYSLLARGVEREVMPTARHHDVGVLAWSPLGRGVLTGKYRYSTPQDSRAANSTFSSFVQPYLEDSARGIVDAVAIAAEGLSVTPLEVALAWVRDRVGVTSAIVGARTAEQITATLAADEISLPQEITAALDDVSAIDLGYPDHGWNQRGV
jgi:aryl-alcohol dehydrogenase-like predicted oxidoreductase